MFGNNKKIKQRLSELEQQLVQREAEIQRLAAEKQTLQSRLGELEAASSSAADRFEQDLCGTWIKGGALIQSTRDGIAGTAEGLQREQSSLQDSLSIFAESQEAVENILRRVDHISERASQGGNGLTELVTVTGQIEKFVSVIGDISDQTNLLALNAAIEAARAGESGRGFAVVADEVRNLARKASDASQEIAALVSEIVARTQTVGKDIDSVQGASSEVVASAEQIRAGVAQVVDLSGHMHSVIRSSAAEAFFETVKLDHVAWKNQIYDSIIGKKHDHTDAVADHTACRLGQWYFSGEGQERYSHLPSYGRLDMPHETVHREGRAALEAARTGSFAQVSQHLAKMEEASVKVADVIDALSRELVSH